jgi:hypothetical protein
MPVATTPPGGVLIRGRIRAQIERCATLCQFILNANAASSAKVPPLPFLLAGQATQFTQTIAVCQILLLAKIPVPPPPV